MSELRGYIGAWIELQASEAVMLIQGIEPLEGTRPIDRQIDLPYLDESIPADAQITVYPIFCNVFDRPVAEYNTKEEQDEALKQFKVHVRKCSTGFFKFPPKGFMGNTRPATHFKPSLVKQEYHDKSFDEVPVCETDDCTTCPSDCGPNFDEAQGTPCLTEELVQTTCDKIPEPCEDEQVDALAGTTGEHSQE